MSPEFSDRSLITSSVSRSLLIILETNGRASENSKLSLYLIHTFFYVFYITVTESFFKLQIWKHKSFIIFSFGTSLLTINNIAKSSTKGISTRYELKDVSFELKMNLKWSINLTQFTQKNIQQNQRIYNLGRSTHRAFKFTIYEKISQCILRKIIWDKCIIFSFL